jgi:hypothetical protein
VPAIEIRPRRATELVDAGFQLVRRYYAQLITVAAIAMAPTVILRVVMRDTLSDPKVMAAHPGALFVSFFVGLVFTTVADAVLVVAVSDGYLNGSIDLADATRRGAGRVVQVFVASILRWFTFVFLGVISAVLIPLFAKLGIGWLLVVIMPVALFAAFYFVLRTFAVQQAVLIERKGVIASFTRTWALSENCGAHIFFTLCLLFLLYIVIYGVVIGVAAMVVSRWISEVIGSLAAVAIYPILATVVTLLYYDLRVRKEGFDLEVMSRELGTEGGAPGSAPLPAV